MTVAEHLAASRAAHARFQAASGHNPGDRGTLTMPDDNAAAEALEQAQAARKAAQDADPQRTDPAWAADAAAMRGVTTEALMSFYAEFTGL